MTGRPANSTQVVARLPGAKRMLGEAKGEVKGPENQKPPAGTGGGDGDGLDNTQAKGDVHHDG